MNDVLEFLQWIAHELCVDFGMEAITVVFLEDFQGSLDGFRYKNAETSWYNYETKTALIRRTAFKTQKPRLISSLIRSVVHECAHELAPHKGRPHPDFHRAFKKTVDWAKEKGYYQPRRT